MQTAQVGAGDWLAEVSDDPDGVREFCARHDILDEARTSIALARRHFHAVEKLTLSVWKDPLDGVERLRVFVEVRSSVEEALEAYALYARDWVERAPFPKGERIYFSYTIA